MSGERPSDRAQAEDGLKLTAYFGERDRVHGGFLADALIGICERHGVRTSLLLRGVEGFGIHHHLQTARLLTLSEDLPVVAVAVDTRATIQALLPEVSAITAKGLLTLERARLLPGAVAASELPPGPDEAVKLTVYIGRQQRARGRPAYLEVVDLLHRRGVAGATVLLGVDGTVHGRRRRARFFARNADVPLMVISVGDREPIASVLPELADLLDSPPMTVERVRVHKRDGQRLSEPLALPERDESGLGRWQKLMVYAGEQARHEGRPLYSGLIRRLREQGAVGATALRGVWGYHGSAAPHGDRFGRLARHMPTLTVIVDRPDAIRRWFAVVDEFTDETGLVTSEIVPALRAPAAGGDALRLARPR